MTRDEIEFCERWIELRRPDLQGAVPWDTSRPHAIADNHARGRYWDRALGSLSAGLSDLLELTPRGQDLVASYEAAKASGLEIRPDPGPGESRPWLARDPKPMTVVCDCDDGFIGIPVAYAPNGGILRVWPARCPKCDVERGTPVAAAPTDGRLDDPALALDDAIARGWASDPAEIVNLATVAKEHGRRLQVRIRSSADPIGRQRLGYVTDLDLGEEMPIYFDGSWRFVGGVRPRETTITAARVAP